MLHFVKHDINGWTPLLGDGVCSIAVAATCNIARVSVCAYYGQAIVTVVE